MLLVKKICSHLLTLALIFSLTLSSKHAFAGSMNAQGAAGMAMGAAQMGLAGVNMVESYDDCVAQSQTGKNKYAENWKQCLSTGLNALAMLGGLASMLGNSGTEDATSGLDSTLPDLSSLGGPSGGVPGLGNLGNYKSPNFSSVLTDICDKSPSLCKYKCDEDSDACNIPSFQTPISNTDLLDKLAHGIQNGTVDTGGLSPEEFLTQISDGLEKTTNALDELNALASKTDFSNPSEFAALEDIDELGEDGLPVSGKGRKGDSGDLASSDSFDLDLEGLFGKKAEERGAKEAVSVQNGQIVEKETGKKLSIFDRMVRALRGKENTRDLLLARHGLLLNKAYKLADAKKKAEAEALQNPEESTTPEADVEGKSPASEPVLSQNDKIETAKP